MEEEKGENNEKKKRKNGKRDLAARRTEMNVVGKRKNR